MARDSSAFPIFMQMVYREGDAFTELQTEAQKTASRLRSTFGSAFQGIGKTVSDSLALPLKAGGILDLKPERIRAAADAAAAQASALRDVADAARRVALSDPSPAFAKQAAEARGASLAADEVSRAVASEALALDRLQAELVAAGVQTGKLASAQRGYVGSANASRQATVQAGQQLQDIAISIGSGQRASVVLAQQLPQLAFAFSNAGGAAGAVGRFLSGPWGVALALGSFALGPLIDGLFKTTKAAEDVKFASFAMGDAQSILGNVLDITTGKISSQNAALFGLAKAQILVARVQAQTRAADARRGVQDIQFRETKIGGGLGGGFSIKRRDIDARDVISQQVLSGTLGSSAAVDRLENLRKIGKLTDDQFASAAASVANLGVELQNVRVFSDAENLLKGTGGRGLLKPAKAKKVARPKASGAADRLAEFGEDTGAKIANIADQFGDTPTAITRINKALRQLDDLASDLERKKPLNLDEYLTQLKEAKVIVGNSLSTAFDRIVAKQGEQVRIQDLLNTGREREARILETLSGLGDLDVRDRVEALQAEIRASAEVLATSDATAKEQAKATAALAAARAEYEKLAPLAERQAKWAAESTDSEIRRAEAARVYSEQVQRFTGVIASTRGSLEDLFAGGKVTDFFGTVRQNFIRLRSEMAVESLFGGSLRQLDQMVRRNDPVNREITNFAEQAGLGSIAITAHAEALTKATAIINGTPAANDNSDLASETNPNGIILVEALRRTNIGLKPTTLNDFTRQFSEALTKPLLSQLDRLLGTNFFIGLQGAVSGGLAGYIRAGNVGAGLGAAQGIFDTLSKNTKLTAKASESLKGLSDKFGKGLGGAQTGDQTAQLLRSIGIKTSRTGGQIGGAIGSFLPIPGGEIIGSIIGSTVGGLFKKTPKGSVNISDLNSDLSFAGSKKLKGGVLGLGGNVQSSLNNIIEQLNGVAGTFAVSVGQRGKNFTVDPTGKGRTKGSGVQKFKSEDEAARAALLDAIKDGAIAGISDGAKRLLAAGKDLDRQLQKAVSFQGVFDRLRTRKDPLGAAIDNIDREFKRLKTIFDEAGASVQERAQLEELYGLERADAIKEASDRIVGSLRDLYKELTVGNEARSLTERLGFAQANFDPLAARVAKGDSTAFDDFAAAARELLGIRREFSGSQAEYFGLLDQVTNLTKSTLAASGDINAAAINRDSPFTATGAVANDNGAVIGAINEQTNLTLAALNRAVAGISETNVLLRQSNGSGREYALSGRTFF